MNGWDWFLVATIVLSGVLTLLEAGKPRKPISPDLAVAICMFDVLLIIAVVLS